MKTVLCHEFGPPESLKLETLDRPTPGPGEVLIDIKATALNFPDVLMIEGKYQSQPPMPFSPGGEVAGTVGALAAITNAVQDAVWDRGLRNMEMPFTPNRVWTMLQEA